MEEDYMASRNTGSDQCGSRDVASVDATAPLTTNLYTPWTAEWDDEYADWHVMGAPYDAGDGVTGQPNICTLSDYGTGDIARLIAAAPELLEACRSALPTNLALDNPNIPDSAKIPLDFTMGELRRIAAAIAGATSTYPRSE